MILADENIPLRMIESLRAEGVNVLSIYETNRGITDKAIIDIAIASNRIILTEDKDFGEWVFAHGINSISVLFLRYTFPEQTVITEILIRLLRNKGNALMGKFVTITTEKIRYREI